MEPKTPIHWHSIFVGMSLQKFVLAVMLHKTIKYLDKGTFIKKIFFDYFTQRMYEKLQDWSSENFNESFRHNL